MLADILNSLLYFKGIREGGVSNNTTFYVFTHGKDGAFEAFPIKDWFVFFFGINGSCAQFELQVQLHSNTEVQDPGC